MGWDVFKIPPELKFDKREWPWWPGRNRAGGGRVKEEEQDQEAGAGAAEQRKERAPALPMHADRRKKVSLAVLLPAQCHGPMNALPCDISVPGMDGLRGACSSRSLCNPRHCTRSSRAALYTTLTFWTRIRIRICVCNPSCHDDFPEPPADREKRDGP
jgi:hypothetical protein